MPETIPTLVKNQHTKPLNGGLKDIPSMSGLERLQLLYGSRVYIACLDPGSRTQTDSIIEVPLQAIRAVSRIANTHFLADDTEYLYLSSDGAFVTSVRAIVTWIREACSARKFCTLIPRASWLSNVLIYQAMQTLAMEAYCTKGLLDYFFKEITLRHLDYVDLRAILLYIGPLDPIYQLLAKTRNFAQWLEAWPEFKVQLAEADKRNQQWSQDSTKTRMARVEIADKAKEAVWPWHGSFDDSPPRESGGNDAEENDTRDKVTIIEVQDEEDINEGTTTTVKELHRDNPADAGSILTVKEVQHDKEAKIRHEATSIESQRTDISDVQNGKATLEIESCETAEVESKTSPADIENDAEPQNEEDRPTLVQGEAPKLKGTKKWKPLYFETSFSGR